MCLLVPAHPGSPRQKGRKTVVVVVVPEIFASSPLPQQFHKRKLLWIKRNECETSWLESA